MRILKEGDKMVKKNLKVVEETPAKISKKDLEYLITICNMAKQVIDKYDDPDIAVGLELAFTTDLITPNGVNIRELIDEDIRIAFFEYSLKVGDKLRERGII